LSTVLSTVVDPEDPEYSTLPPCDPNGYAYGYGYACSKHPLYYTIFIVELKL